MGVYAKVIETEHSPYDPSIWSKGVQNFAEHFNECFT